jgi:hypothetical protein
LWELQSSDVATQTVIEASKVKLRLEIFGDDKLPAGSGQLANKFTELRLDDLSGQSGALLSRGEEKASRVHL